jgi:hypothetical protein
MNVDLIDNIRIAPRTPLVTAPLCTSRVDYTVDRGTVERDMRLNLRCL